MSYCQFENTLGDLADCVGALYREEYKGCSSSEKTAMLELIDMCKKISDEYGDITFNFSKHTDEENEEDENEDEKDDIF